MKHLLNDAVLYSLVTVSGMLELTVLPTSLDTSQAYSAASSRVTVVIVRLVAHFNGPHENRPEHCTSSHFEFTYLFHTIFVGRGYESMEHIISAFNPSLIISLSGSTVRVGGSEKDHNTH